MNPSKLIITADDYGVTESVSRGIQESILCGNVSCTSVMINYVSGDDIESLLELKKKKSFGIGLHINLTEGISITTGQEFNRDKLNDLKFIREEMTAQISLFSKIFDEIDHINFHQHIHYDLRVLQEFLLLDESKHIPVRYVNQLMKSILKANNRFIPDRFVNLFPFFSASAEFKTHLKSEIEILKNNDYGIVEWMVHPGYTCSELEQLAPNYSVRREEELKLMCSDELTAALASINIIPSSFNTVFI